MAWNVEASQLDDQRHLAHTLAILLTVGGTPSIYAGDEQGFRGVKEQRAGGDDAVRPVFPDTPGQLAPDGWGVYRLHQQLIGVRRRHLWLHHARAEPLHLTNTQLVYQVGTDRQRLLVALNLQDTAVDLPAPGASPGLRRWRGVVGVHGHACHRAAAGRRESRFRVLFRSGSAAGR